MSVPEAEPPFPTTLAECDAELDRLVAAARTLKANLLDGGLRSKTRAELELFRFRAKALQRKAKAVKKLHRALAKLRELP